MVIDILICCIIMLIITVFNALKHGEHLAKVWHNKYVQEMDAHEQTKKKYGHKDAITRDKT